MWSLNAVWIVLLRTGTALVIPSNTNCANVDSVSGSLVSLEKMEILQAKSVCVANNKGDMAVSPGCNSEIVPFPFL